MKQLDLQEELVKRCIRGDAKAQSMLYKQYSKAMYNICLRMQKTAEDAEDVMQNGFIEVFRGLKSYKGRSTLGAWIKRIVVNNNIDFLKKNKYFFEEIDEQKITEKAEAPELPIKYDIPQVKQAIGMLPDGYRMVFSLYLLEGYDHREIAEILNVTTATSKSQYSRAKKKLVEIIKSEYRKEVI